MRIRERLESVLRDEIRRGVFPGAAYACGNDGVRIQGAVGRISFSKESAEATVHTMYDLASLTKPLCTAAVIAWAVAEGRLRLSDPVCSLLPTFVGQGRERIELRHLLTHTSGLPAYDSIRLRAPDPEALRTRILSHAPSSEPGSRAEYSCVGFLVLQYALEAAFGEPLDRTWSRVIARPLRLHRLRFGPLDVARLPVAPTEKDRAWRKKRMWGHVHDPLAWQQGGVSGNAGLFGTADAVARFCRAMLCDDPQWPWLREYRDWTVPMPGDARGLGWDLYSRAANPQDVGCSARTFGHTGFTGCSMWVDPERRSYVVLLSNRADCPWDPTAISLARARFLVAWNAVTAAQSD